ncbi:Multicopper oxidase [hydrothermal vent metagenome]|uniref:Multicopper oxidase n=1 Tax=hydrothermal vent metagenome TaxID=652676 RepID=A0A3B0WZC7_9ZZZZ
MKRRDFLTISIRSIMAAGLTSVIPLSLLRSHSAHAALAAAGLSDPAAQPLFTNLAPNALSKAYKYAPKYNTLNIYAAQTVQMTGLVGVNGVPVPTTVWGYGTQQKNVTWPGYTIERHVKDKSLDILWSNTLVDAYYKPLPHLLPVDGNLHWAYSLSPDISANGIDYRQFSIAKDGVPLVPHVHGGKNDSSFDGNPEYFFSPYNKVTGPRYITNSYEYGGSDWNETAGMMWYHDHALGLTRLNVYAGLSGFFTLRDDYDTGKTNNLAGLPADPYELGYLVQDRMFRNTGELFYPAFPNDPAYSDFITDEGVVLPSDLFPGGGPTALAEFFGDHIVVNGVIWPKANVEKRQYRIRFLNGSDSRFMRLKLRVITGGASNPTATDPSVGYELPFYVVGSDQGLRATEAQVNEVDFIPAERLDLVIDFKNVQQGDRVIVENILGDSPFGGDLPGPADLFPDRRTDRIMAFDVELPFNPNILDTYIGSGVLKGGGIPFAKASKVRKLGLFEGSDEFGRLQPLLGVAEPTLDVEGNLVDGTLAWFKPVTETPALGDTEIWEIYNATGDAHPIHVHLVHFEIMNRQSYTSTLIEQPTQQPNGSVGVGFRLANIVTTGVARLPDVAEQTRRDVVMALPGEVTRIKMTFDKPGRYVWHCHILSHEDHEMMRPFIVVDKNDKDDIKIDDDTAGSGFFNLWGMR